MDAQTTTASSATATLDAFSLQLQDLPVTSLLPAGILLLLGLLLLVCGKHLLRPVLVVAIVLAGAMLGVPLLGGLLPDSHGLVLTLLGGLAGALLAAVAWRLFLGAALGVTLAFFCALLALFGADAGLIDARSAADAPPSSITLSEVADRQRLIERSPEPVRPLVAWAEAKWHAESPQVQVLLKAAAFGGAFIGLVLGAWLSQGASAFLTSLVGALFALLGGMPFLLRALERADEPVRPIAWLLLWAALAGAGWLLQSWRAASEPNDAARGARESAAENG
jgi:hypothetical protein